MKRLTTAVLLLALALPVTGLAQKEKVVEASSKHKPGWIGRSDGSAICVTEVGQTLAEVSERSLGSIRQHIINAVAVNVSASETMISRQITRDNLTSVMNDYSSQLMTEAAKLPYISEITLSNAEDIYWERIYDKRTKSYRYEYSVRYPFTEQNRRELVAAFVAIDDARMAAYERLRRDWETLDDLDRIRPALNELDGLYDYFFDATRRADVETLRRNYRDLYNRLSIVIESDTLGSCRYSLRLGNRRVTTSVAPRLTSSSAIDMHVRPCEDRCYVLSYNPEYASPDDENRIEILYLFGGKRIAESVFFDPASKRTAVQPIDVVRIEQHDTALRGTLRLRVRGVPVAVTGLRLVNPADGAEATAGNLVPERLEAGEHTLAFELDRPVGPAPDGLEFIRGTVTFRNTADKQESERNFILPLKLIQR